MHCKILRDNYSNSWDEIPHYSLMSTWLCLVSLRGFVHGKKWNPFYKLENGAFENPVPPLKWEEGRRHKGKAIPGIDRASGYPWGLPACDMPRHPVHRDAAGSWQTQAGTRPGVHPALPHPSHVTKMSLTSEALTPCASVFYTVRC